MVCCCSSMITRTSSTEAQWNSTHITSIRRCRSSATESYSAFLKTNRYLVCNRYLLGWLQIKSLSNCVCDSEHSVLKMSILLNTMCCELHMWFVCLFVCLFVSWCSCSHVVFKLPEEGCCGRPTELKDWQLCCALQVCAAVL